MRKQKTTFAVMCMFMSLSMTTTTLAAEISASESHASELSGYDTQNNMSDQMPYITSNSSNAAISNMSDVAAIASLLNSSLDTETESQISGSGVSNVLAESSDSWLKNAVDKLRINGFDTSNFMISDTSSAQNLINSKYNVLLNNLEEQGYGKSYELETYTLSDSAANAEDVFQSVYGAVYDSMKEGQLSQSLDDYRKDGVTIPTFADGEITKFDASHISDITLPSAEAATLPDTSGIQQDINSTTEKIANTDIGAGSLAVAEMISTFQSQLNNSYSDYINTDSYNAVNNAISTYNVADMVANRTKLSDTISTAALVSDLNSLSSTISASAAATKVANFASVTSAAAANASAAEAAKSQSMQKAESWFTTACTQAKAASGYNQAVKTILGKDTYTNAEIRFDNGEDAIAYCNAAGLSVDCMGYDDDGNQVVNPDTGVLYISVDEAKKNEDLINEYGGTIGYATFTTSGIDYDEKANEIKEEKEQEYEHTDISYDGTTKIVNWLLGPAIKVY